MAYRNKLYIAFDGDNDMSAYRTLQMWEANNSINFDFHNAHDLFPARDSSMPESIKRQLRQRMLNSKAMLLLVGTNTRFLRRFVPYEIELARRLDLPIIVANLNNNRKCDSVLCPKAAKDSIASTVHVTFKARIIQFALENFPGYYRSHKFEGHGLYYEDDIYQRCGL